MIKIKVVITALIFISLLVNSCSDNEINCTLKGKIVGRDSDTIFLFKAYEDPRLFKIPIPVRDSVFKYKLKIPQIEAYQLVFDDDLKSGRWRNITFFPDNKVLEFSLYASNYSEKNKISGGKLNDEVEKYNAYFESTFVPQYDVLDDSLSILRDNDLMYSDSYKTLVKEWKETEDDNRINQIRKELNKLHLYQDDLTPRTKAIYSQIDTITKHIINWRYQYIKSNPSLVSFYFILSDIMNIKTFNYDLNKIKKNHEILSSKYPSHPYNLIVGDLLKANEQIRVGEKFIDFSAPDLEGHLYQLSDLIKNKVALIDFWSPWCGPCILTSQSMIPVFEEYKNKGFTVCGIASVTKDTEQLKKMLEKENYPWITLVELDNMNRLWNKYNLINSGGGTFLIDNQGLILSINPNAKEVRKIFKERLDPDSISR